jgi:hypothetical protein
MSIDLKALVKSTKKTSPPKMLIYSEHGLGKSSLAAAAPSPVFVNIEDGLSEIETNAFPVAETYEDVKEQLSAVLQEEHQYKTLVIDTVDWLETLINEYVCQQGGKDSISDFGYGAGFQQTFEETVKIVKMLNRIHREKNMGIILLSHAVIKSFSNPLGGDYDTYRLKLREKNAELYLEYVTLVSFLHIPVFVTTEKKGFSEKTKTVASGRVLSVSPNAGFSAKNRYNITEDIQIPSPTEGFKNLMNAIKS